MTTAAQPRSQTPTTLVLVSLVVLVLSVATPGGGLIAALVLHFKVLRKGPLSVALIILGAVFLAAQVMLYLPVIHHSGTSAPMVAHPG